uniref:F180B protein n=1 Tax=Apteryx owenii TaxID=8824 RepID=A0A8B9QR09_APTOW
LLDRVMCTLWIVRGLWHKTEGTSISLHRRVIRVCLLSTEVAENNQTALLFQMLWAGLEIEANTMVQLRDEELASLRPARRFLWILENEVPKTPTEIEQQLKYYSLTDTPLPVTEFDHLLFTSVYCAYQIRSIQGLDKNLWISLFSQLVDEIFRDLCKGFCPGVDTGIPVEFILDYSVLPPYIHSMVSAECSIFFFSPGTN